MKKRRVVITGLGVVAPNGIGKDAFWQATINGKSGVDYIISFDTSELNSKIAAQVTDFDPLKYMSSQVAKRTDRFVHFGLASARMALKDSGLDLERENRDRPECDLDYVPNNARKSRLNTVLLNSFGVGNNNACIFNRTLLIKSFFLIMWVLGGEKSYWLLKSQKSLQKLKS